MTALLLEPHQDDAALFAAFTCLRYRPLVVTVLRSVVQERYGIFAATREAESREAMGILGCVNEQWTFGDAEPDWDDIRLALAHLQATDAYDRVFAPAVIEHGHDHHNRVGELADEVFGADRVTHYHTYSRRDGKTEDGLLVEYEPAWVTLKLRALACYRSQIETAAAGCTAHFLRDQREWVEG